MWRKRRAKLNHLVVKQRHPGFNGSSHAHLVSSRQEIVREPELGIDVKHAVERHGGICASQMAGKDTLRAGERRAFPHHCVGKQRRFLSCAEKWEPMEKASG